MQEEVGLRGAAAAAFGVDPDLAIVLDVTIAGDSPGIKEFDTSLKIGKGPALCISDSGMITHPKVLKWLLESAEEQENPVSNRSGFDGFNRRSKNLPNKARHPKWQHLNSDTLHS